MEVHCPNCATKLAISVLDGPPASCGGCAKSVYFPHQGLFPPIVPLTFPSQASPPVELVPFFHVVASEMAVELKNLEPGPTIPNRVMNEAAAAAALAPEPQTAIARLDELHAQSAAGAAQVSGTEPPIVEPPVSATEPPIQPQAPQIDIAPPNAQPGDNGTAPMQAPMQVSGTASGSGPTPNVPIPAIPGLPAATVMPAAEAQVAVATTAAVPPPVAAAPPAAVGAGEENLELLSLAGGSFAAALTPPPMPGKAPGAASASPSLQSMSTLGPAPWDTVAPPPLGKDGKDDQWSVSDGPPPLASKGNGSGPPPVPKKNEMDAFAQALGLPSIPQNDRPEKAPPPAVIVPVESATAAVAEAEKAADAAAEKSYKKKLLIFGGIGIIACVAIAVIIAGAATKDLPKDPPPATATGGLQASGATGVSGDSAVSGTNAATGAQAASGKPDDKKVDPQKRATALEHYAKGNKLYLQKKYGDALAEYKKALDADAAFALAYRGLGVTYASQNKREKAIESYKAYLRMAPDAKDANLVKAIIQKAESEK
ncbi:MAG: tetratricopeptide repeat protein [Deltaproteobacteria bacterium]|nr:tetratricopeptide repeat protein [Deltaproteobacteria bacterium]